jgi:hypothetical protein
LEVVRDLADDHDFGYVVFDIANVAAVSTKITADKIKYVDIDGPWNWREQWMYIDIGEGNEYSFNGSNWCWAVAETYLPDGHTSEEKWARILQEPKKQIMFIRHAAEETQNDKTHLPSKVTRFTIPALPKAPRVRIDIGKGVLVGKADWEISTDHSGEWAKMTQNTLPLGKVIELPSVRNQGEMVEIDLRPINDRGQGSTTVMVRIPGEDNRPTSTPSIQELSFWNAGCPCPPGREDVNVFTPGPNRTIVINSDWSSFNVEVKINDKWRRVKSLKADDIPTEGLQVRMAGNRKLNAIAGPEHTLKIHAVGDAGEILLTNYVSDWEYQGWRHPLEN